MRVKILFFLAIFAVCTHTMAQNTDTTDIGVVINGIKWATRNVDKPKTFAANPEETGMFYQWNSDIAWSATDLMINSNGGTEWEQFYSAGWKVTNNVCPVGWRLPTHIEIETLLEKDKVIGEWIAHKGCKFTDKTTNNSLFLSAAGFRDKNGKLYLREYCGIYRGSTRGNSADAYSMYFNYLGQYGYGANVSESFSVRCVAE
ncbi:MAG: fibrobacter succinogenes major paralogous domain-containing protein [Prevotellaceae bacterium]|nr:fibrobacter succinogenes major paralogous domain-containing protein [Prevotellaceae bacterium]